MKIKAAIFDMDGTLVDSLSFWGLFWADLGKKYLGVEGFVPDPEADRSVRTMIMSETAPYIRNYYNINESDESFFEYVLSYLNNFYKEKAKEKAGATPLLEYLRGEGVKICLASASEMSGIKIATNATGLAKHFDLVLSCADVGAGKDKPDVYLKAAELLGCNPEEICVFEDSFVALETARGAGFLTVGVYDKFNYGQDRLKNASDIYLSEGERLDSVIGRITAK